MKKQMAFQTRLSLTFALLILTGLAISGGISYHLSAQLIRDNVVAGLQAQIAEAENLITVTQKENRDRLNLLMSAWAPVSRDTLRIDAAKRTPTVVENQANGKKVTVALPALLVRGAADPEHRFVDQIARDTGVASTIFVRTPEGFVRVSTSIRREDRSRVTGTFIPNDSPVARALNEGRRYDARAQVVGRWYNTAYEPLKQDGQTVGAFFLGTPDTSTATIREHLKTKTLFQTGYYFILDGTGRMVLHPTLEGKDVLETTALDGQKIFQSMLERKSGVLDYSWLNAETREVQPKLAPFHHLKDVDWYVAASINQDEALAPLARLKWSLLSVAFAVSLVVVVISALFGRSVARRLTEVAGTIRKTFHDVETSAAEFVAQSESLAESSTQQAAGLQQTVAAVEEIQATVMKNLDQARSVASSAEDTNARAREGQKILHALSGSIGEISRGNDDLRLRIAQSDERMKKIFEVFAAIQEKTRMINEIVFQTKLLSFNASVEAARAGEHGKGFSVVAEEVGRLAAQSGRTAEEIRETLERSNAEVTALISDNRTAMNGLIDESSRRIGAGVETVGVAETTFQEIIQRVEAASASLQEISRASNEQTRGVEEIARAMQEIDKGTQSNSAAAVEIKAMSGRLATDAIHAGEALARLQQFLDGGPATTTGPTTEKPPVEIRKTTPRAA